MGEGQRRELLRTWRVVAVILISVAMASCGVATGPVAETAQEFVAKYSRAYRDGNARSIAKMTVLEGGQTEESFRDEVQKDIDSKGFGYVAWTHARYMSEVDNGNCIHVDVEVQGPVLHRARRRRRRLEDRPESKQLRTAELPRRTAFATSEYAGRHRSVQLAVGVSSLEGPSRERADGGRRA
jgi:hypothetical protein